MYGCVFPGRENENFSGTREDHTIRYTIILLGFLFPNACSWESAPPHSRHPP